MIIVRTGVVDGVVQASTLLALQRLTGDEIAYVYHITQFANLLIRFDAFEEVFRLFVIYTRSTWTISLRKTSMCIPSMRLL